MKNKRKSFFLIFFLILVSTVSSFINFALMPSIEMPLNEEKSKLFKINFPKIKETVFTRAVKEVLLTQYDDFISACKGSDIFRPKTKKCINKTNTNETELSSLALMMLLTQQKDNSDVHNIKSILESNSFIETGYVADNIIAPLMSAFIVSGNENYLKEAKSIGEMMLDAFETSPFPFTYIVKGTGMLTNQQKYPFFNEISSLIPVFASLFYHTKEKRFINYINKFLKEVEASFAKNGVSLQLMTKDDTKIFPVKFFDDVQRSMKISKNVKGENVMRYFDSHIKHMDSLDIKTNNFVNIKLIEYCSPLLISRNEKLIEKCESFTKGENLPLRMKGKSEYQTHKYQASFAFEGELLELYWKTGEKEKFMELINNGLYDNEFDNHVTGVINVTVPGTTDDYMHATMFSRWGLSAILHDSEIPFESIVFSRNGHILKYEKS